MGKSSTGDMVENLLDYVEYLIYAVSIALGAAKADMVTSYVLFGLLGFLL